MRIFIGIKFDDSTHEEIEKAVKPFKTISTPIKWVKTENIHLTLKFIGELSEDKYKQIEKVLTGGDFNVGAFDLEIAGFGRFGKGSEINILWAGIKMNEKLENLYRRIEDALAKIGIAKENRPFSPHLTLGRNKKQYNFSPVFKLLQEKGNMFIGKLRVHSFRIFKSELFSTGPVYSILKEIAVANT